MKAQRPTLFVLALFTFSLVAARADMVINRFDSPAEVASWRYDGGLPGGTFTFDPTQDAGGGSSRGAMKLVLPFTAPGGFEFTLDKFPVATNLTAAGYTNLSLDVKVDPASPARPDGNAGWFQLVIRAGDNHYTFLRQYGDNLNTNDGWFHISVPLTGDVTATRGFSFQFSDGGLTNGTRVAWIDNLVLRGGGPSPKVARADSTLPHAPRTSALLKREGEMLVNGSFADGTNHWVLEESGATGRAEHVKEGPDGQDALRVSVLTVGDHTWRLQMYQTGMHVEKGRAYDLTFWAKSDRAGSITANCMQNHEPWDHHTQAKFMVSTEWQPLHFPFVAAWDDDNVRVSFTDLATTPGQVWWFANCSLAPSSGAETAATPASPAAGATDVKTNQVHVYQDDALASAGPFLGKPGLAGAHMGLYANRKMTRATVFNSNIYIRVGN